MDNITVTVEKLETLIEILKNNGAEVASFEFIVGSCFPDIMNNIKAEIHKQSTQGFIDGQKEAAE